MKVLHVLNGLGDGGSESFAINSVIAFEKDYDLEIDFLIRSQENNIHMDEVISKNSKVFIAPSFPKEILKNFFYMKKFFSKERFSYDIVHIHANSLVYLLPLYLLKKHSDVTIILHSHNTQSKDLVSRIIHLINKTILDETNIKKIACSELAGKWMFKSNFEVISNGIDLKRFKFNPRKRIQVRRELGVSDDEIIIGNVGRLVPQKNHEKLIEIFGELVKDNPNYKLLLVGGGPLEFEITKMVSNRGIEDKVIMTGSITNTSEIYHAIDLFIMPSLYEGLPVALVEAQMSGLHAVVSSEAVGRDADITGNLIYLSLDDSLDVWLDTINQINLNSRRVVSVTEIENKGFGLKGLRNKLINLYDL